MIPAELQDHLQQGCLLIGVGNELFGDDAFGPYVIRQLRNRTSLSVLDAGSAPENIAGLAARLNPSEIIIMDAVSVDSPAGSMHWIKPDDLQTISFSTHGPSLDLFSIFMNQTFEIPVHILGIVPLCVDLGAPLSHPVRRAADQLVLHISTTNPFSLNHPT